jgi:hypothetical protein
MAHPASVKKAADKGIILEDAPEGSDYRFRAFWAEKGLELWGSNASDLVNVAISAKMIVVETPGLGIEQEDDTITFSFGEHELATCDADCKPAEFQEAISEALDALTDEMRAGVAEADDEEEAEKAGSVVPEKYKAIYKANGTPGNCGDWLALTLKEYTTTEKGQVNPEAVDAIAGANGLSTAKYDRTNNGWQGRLRMTVRNSLVKKIVEKGVLVVPAPFAPDDTEVKAPKEWLKAMAAKHKVQEAALAPNRKKKAA